MNIRALSEKLYKNINFRGVWVVLSILVSANIGIYKFPKLYRELVSVPVYFQAKEDSGPVYWKFNQENVSKHIHKIQMPFVVYYNTCDFIGKENCEVRKNWRSVTYNYFCPQGTCNLDKIALTRELRDLSLSEVIGVDGASRNLKDPLATQNPQSLIFWGEEASWPLTALCFFFLLKLGKEFFEFVEPRKNIQ